MADTQFEAHESKLQKKGNTPSKASNKEKYAGKQESVLKNLPICLMIDREGDPFTAIVDGANAAHQLPPNQTHRQLIRKDERDSTCRHAFRNMRKRSFI